MENKVYYEVVENDLGDVYRYKYEDSKEAIKHAKSINDHSDSSDYFAYVNKVEVINQIEVPSLYWDEDLEIDESYGK